MYQNKKIKKDDVKVLLSRKQVKLTHDEETSKLILSFSGSTRR